MNSPKEWSELWNAMRENWNNNSDAWVETTSEMFHDQLGAVPPIGVIGNAFIMGEPWSTDKAGNYVHAVFVQKGYQFYARYFSVENYQNGNEDLRGWRDSLYKQLSN